MTTDEVKRFIENPIPDSMWDLTMMDLDAMNNTFNKYGLILNISDDMISHYLNGTLKTYLDVEASK